MGAGTDAFLLWIGAYNVLGVLAMLVMLLSEPFADTVFRKPVARRDRV